jgi:hypothetical protein
MKAATTSSVALSLVGVAAAGADGSAGVPRCPKTVGDRGSGLGMCRKAEGKGENERHGERSGSRHPRHDTSMTAFREWPPYGKRHSALMRTPGRYRRHFTGFDLT